MVIEDPTVELELEPGWRAIAEPLDAAASEALRHLFTATARERVAVQVASGDTPDVAGHIALGATMDVVLTVGDDVAGHAFTLHFPSPGDAARMRTRLAAGGLLVAALTVGSIGLATQVAAPQAATGAAIQAVTVAAPAPAFISPALKADLRDGDITREETVPAPVPGLTVTQKE